jgi:hypothetical protein
MKAVLLKCTLAYTKIFTFLRSIPLTKLARNIQRDREDVRYLARSVPFDLNILKQRYTTEHRPYLMGRPENADAVLNLWIEIIEEDRRKMLGNQP